MLHITSDELKKALTASGFIDEKNFQDALAEAQKTDRDIVNVLIEHGNISEEYIAEILADYFGVKYISLKKIELRDEDIKSISEQVAQSKKIIVFGREKDKLKLAMEDPGDIGAIDYVEKHTGQKVIPYITTGSDIRESLGVYKKSIASDFTKIIEENVQKSKAQGLDIAAMAQDLPVINILDTIVEYAIAQRASDIHLEMLPKQFLIRFRIDGILKDIIQLPVTIHPALVARVKILSDLKIDERRSPQDGRFRFETEHHSTAIRVSIIPAFYGEKVVMRLLEESERFLTLEELGLAQRELKLVQEAILHPHGMVLSTGPTGSGKTTTLYTILHILNRPEVNISTIEDPIEYDVKRVNQIQVNPKIGLTFADGLRSLLRQDPDILMVGEIRDKETAEMAIHSALTGHLVLSTLHTNDAAGAVPRLIDMGVEPFLLASTLNLIIAQRLVRKICSNCVVSVKYSDQDLIKMKNQMKGLSKEETIGSKNENQIKMPTKFYKGKGCKQCGGSGYRGRIGIFEILPMSGAIQTLAVQRAPAEKIKAQAVKEKMALMIEDGFRKVEAGLTTLEEVLRVTRE
ncbi:MAG: Type II secretion system protein E [Berkelbacteria bacterium GW2011_GWB1_38_5]|uniref:Type II secretion system protein E n=1 Tax=Berkelbacteria bacterium GW2011_GWB1_38_5 TaxID=1618336 RepID=A0A0G0KFN6_9BACT|nr:MAG: Type II secretion system protein E [Berkelbacteria bacterium GW2011_GWB1_38_5]